MIEPPALREYAVLPVGVDRIRPSEWSVVRCVCFWGSPRGPFLRRGEERERERWVRCGEGERWRVRSLRAWRVWGWGGVSDGGGWRVIRRRERRRTRAGRFPRERPRRGGQDDWGVGGESLVEGIRGLVLRCEVVAALSLPSSCEDPLDGELIGSFLLEALLTVGWNGGWYGFSFPTPCITSCSVSAGQDFALSASPLDVGSKGG